jgi:hypothetical protein
MRKISCPSRARERSEQALQAVDEHITFAERQDEAGGDDKFLTPIYKGIGSESIRVYLMKYKGVPE